MRLETYGVGTIAVIAGCFRINNRNLKGEIRELNLGFIKSWESTGPVNCVPEPNMPYLFSR